MNEIASRALFDAEVEIIARLVESRKGILYSRDYPIIDIGFRAENRPEFRIRMDASEWNDRPPSVALLAASGERLPGPSVPKHNVFNTSAHPNTGHPFVCMAGTLEYHTHTSHVQDLWSNYKDRSSHTLAGIMTQIWSAWLHSSP